MKNNLKSVSNLALSPNQPLLNENVKQSTMSVANKTSRYRDGQLAKIRRPGVVGTGMNFTGAMPNIMMHSPSSHSPVNKNRTRTNLDRSGSNPFITLNQDLPTDKRELKKRRGTSMLRNETTGLSNFSEQRTMLPSVHTRIINLSPRKQSEEYFNQSSNNNLSD